MIYSGIALLSIVLLSCRDDKDTTKLQADQVTASIDETNQSYQDYGKAHCTCTAAATGTDTTPQRGINDI